MRVGNVGKEKQRTMNPRVSPNSSLKRRKSDSKNDSWTKYKSSDAFTKHRECKRYTSVVDGTDAREDTLTRSFIADSDLDMVPF